MILLIEDEEELKKFVKGDSILESVGNDIISYSRAKEIVTAYENQMIEETYRNNLAREEGFEKGHNEGFEQGIEQGIEQGYKERNIEIAKNLLSLNFALEDISKATGLTLDEINNLN